MRLFQNWPNFIDTAWFNWVKNNNKTVHQYDIHIKPFSFSDDNEKKLFKIPLGIDTTPAKKEALKRPYPGLNCEYLQKQTAKINDNVCLSC